jgi:hypothetical protein
VHAIFHREDENAITGYGDTENRATIIGIRKGTKWSFFVQTYRGLFAPIQDEALLEARKL